jgi:glycine cleavage system aminomethyltransferase T
MLARRAVGCGIRFRSTELLDEPGRSRSNADRSFPIHEGGSTMTTTDSTPESLAQAIDRAGSPVELLRNQNWPAFTFPVAPEFTNWRDEQRAWNTSVALMDQSHHMTQLFLDGADLIALLSSISPNTFATFRPGVAKQLISVNQDGYLIGDGILFYNAEGPEGLVLIGHHILIDWVRFNIEKAQALGKDVRYRLEANSHMRQGPPTFYRYELQGPHADLVME